MDFHAILAERDNPKEKKYLIVEDCVTSEEARSLIETTFPGWVVEVLAEQWPL